jgi:DNA-binding GntR family transcriptional regulator
MLDQIETRVRLAMVTTSVTSGPERALKDHTSILEAIRSGDPEQAEAQARKHIDRLRSSLLETMTREQHP